MSIIHTYVEWVYPYQEPDAKLTEQSLIMLVILFVVKFEVVQRMVGSGEAHLTPSVHLKLPLLCMDLCLF